MTRRTFLCGLTLGTLAAPLSGEAQQAAKVWRVGYLGNTSGPQEITEAFRQGLRDLGYVEGQTILIEWRFAEDKPDRFPQLAAELVRLKVDVVVAANAAAVGALKRATTTIPIVMESYGGDPVADGIVASFAQCVIIDLLQRSRRRRRQVIAVRARLFHCFRPHCCCPER